MTTVNQQLRDKILIVGGYGNVGRVIASDLADTFPGRVIVAGRNQQKAQAFAATTNGKVLKAAEK